MIPLLKMLLLLHVLLFPLNVISIINTQSSRKLLTTTTINPTPNINELDHLRFEFKMYVCDLNLTFTDKHRVNLTDAFYTLEPKCKDQLIECDLDFINGIKCSETTEGVSIEYSIIAAVLEFKSKVLDDLEYARVVYQLKLESIFKEYKLQFHVHSVTGKEVIKPVIDPDDEDTFKPVPEKEGDINWMWVGVTMIGCICILSFIIQWWRKQKLIVKFLKEQAELKPVSVQESSEEDSTYVQKMKKKYDKKRDAAIEEGMISQSSEEPVASNEMSDVDSYDDNVYTNNAVGDDMSSSWG